MHQILRYSLTSLFVLVASSAAAVGTRRFVLDDTSEFKGGDLKGVALDSDGHVRAGLALGAVPATGATSVWSALPMADGSLLLGTGNEGKLLKLQNGAVSVLAETKALVITSLTQGFGGSVIAGTLPDGKVMKWEKGKLTELASLKGAEHVWSVAYDAKAKVVYAATGPEGKLYRITQTGDAQVYFDAPEQHLMSVAVAPDGTVYTGASDKAKLYKVTGPGRAGVLYDFGRTEVRAIAVNQKGEVFAIANDIKSSSSAPSRARSGESPAQPSGTASKTKGKGTLFSFGPDGKPDQLLDDSDEHYTSLALGDDGRPYVGTGVEGRVYTVDAGHTSVMVADAEERQIGALVMAGKDRFVVSSDPAVVHPVKGTGGPDAVWTSKVLDAGIRARFGQLSWDSSGALELSTRTGNTKEPDDTWSAWSNPFTAPGLVTSPVGRYLQVRARFAKDPNAVLSQVEVAFLTDNLRAVLTSVDARGGDGETGDDSPKPSGGPITRRAESTVNLTWKIDNPDKDELRYRLQYRLMGTNDWFDLLKPGEKLSKESYSWETSDLPEGRYRVRVTASDEISNPPDRVTKDARESGVVLVDNTPPSIDTLAATGTHIKGIAQDGVGPIARIELSVAGSDEWFPFFPADGIFDEQREELDLDVKGLVKALPALISVRVYDKANNFVVRSVLVK
ncbi:MAG TPA: fibronectin type III domain-containing protein [Polyangiaceae bacterium]|nr:fibronectin type III domain-containing protein [Polyangiaceae bacterium]